MTKTLRLLSLLLITIFASRPVAAQMRITEYIYDGANKEWVEFTNVGPTPVDMTGYSYDDDSRNPGTVSLSAFGIVQPGESVILAEAGASDFRTAWHLCGQIKIIGNLSTNLSRADEINLFDGSNALVDRLTFGDQAIPGSIRAQNKSGWVSADSLGANHIRGWTLSSAGDAEGSYASTGGDIGSPGKSTRAPGGTPYNPCITIGPDVPTIAIDVANTSDALDGGATANIETSYAIGSTLHDPNDPVSIQGISFIIGDDATAPADLTLTVSSSNTAVLPNANLVLSGSGASRKLTITPAAVGYADITVTVSDATHTNSFIINYAASSAASTSSHWPTGISDASAAIPLGDNYMVIANDESNLLYIYDRNGSGLPVKTFDFNSGNILGLTDGSTGNWKEIDLEAAAATPGDSTKIFWLGSMSNNSSSEYKPNRDRIFQTQITGTGATTSIANAGSYSGLRQLLITWGDLYNYNFTAAAADGKDAKTIDGFNAEGMVFAPDNTTLYIGFRAPLVPLANRTKAVIAPIRNFESWFNNGAPSGTPAIGAPIELDLGGRGIRDMIRLSNGIYVIIAGSYDGNSIPAVFTWSGNASDAPVYVSSFDLTGLNAEAVLPVNQAGSLAADRLQIITDNGDDIYYNDGIAAKDLAQDNFKKFANTLVVASSGTPLPVDYTYFTAKRNAGSVALDWATGHPGDAIGFDVLRSEDGTKFSSIATIAALRDRSTYRYTDADAPAGRIWYRIRANEFSGATALSTIRVIGAEGSAAGVRVYPNPVTNGVFTVTSDNAISTTISVYSSAGPLMQKYQYTGNARDISTTGWPKGLYLLKIQTQGGNEQTIKLLVR